jgi:hypothetical protein
MSKSIFYFLLGMVLFPASQGVAQKVKPVPENPKYPLNIEASAARQQAAEDSWNAFLSEYRLTFVKPELEPIIYTPRLLPTTIANLISLKTPDQKPDEILGEAQIKELLRRFIEKYHTILSGDLRSSSLTLKDVSLIAFSLDGNFYRATYQQMNYPFPLANGFGEIKIAVSKTGNLLQLSSTVLPPDEFPVRAKIEASEIKTKLANREFTYSNLAGQPMTYKVTQESEIEVRDLVVFPKRSEQKLTLYLAYPVEVGRGTTWTIYIDAISGKEIEIKQNFQS